MIPASRLSLPGARGALEGRHGELCRALTRAAPRAIESAIKAMFLRFPASANAPDMAARIAVYVHDLQQFPIWAVDQALSRLTGQFAPSAVDLVESVLALVQPVINERAQITKILTADVAAEPTKQDRAMVEQGFKDLIDGLRPNDPLDTRKGRPPTRAEALRAVDDMRAEPVALPAMSDRLRASLGLGEAAE